GLLLDAEDAADARTDDRTDALGIGLVDLQPGIIQSHERGGQAVVDERLHLLGVLGRDEDGGVEITDLAGDAGAEPAGVEIGDRADAGSAVDDAVPTAGQGVAQRRYHAHAGDHDATLTHWRLLTVSDRFFCAWHRRGCGRRMRAGPHAAAPSLDVAPRKPEVPAAAAARLSS